MKLENRKSEFAVDEEKIAKRIGIARFGRHFYRNENVIFTAMKTQRIYDGRKENFKVRILSATTGLYLYLFVFEILVEKGKKRCWKRNEIMPRALPNASTCCGRPCSTV